MLFCAPGKEARDLPLPEGAPILEREARLAAVPGERRDIPPNQIQQEHERKQVMLL